LWGRPYEGGEVSSWVSWSNCSAVSAIARPPPKAVVPSDCPPAPATAPTKGTPPADRFIEPREQLLQTFRPSRGRFDHPTHQAGQPAPPLRFRRPGQDFICCSTSAVTRVSQEAASVPRCLCGHPLRDRFIGV